MPLGRSWRYFGVFGLFFNYSVRAKGCPYDRIDGCDLFSREL